MYFQNQTGPKQILLTTEKQYSEQIYLIATAFDNLT